MNIERGGYAEEISTELGIKADGGLTRDIVKDISKTWDISRAQLKDPVAVLIGGFQGSGKTTVSRVLSSDLKFPVVSPDEIRYQLLQRDIAPPNEEFNLQVFAVRNNLISFLGQEKASFILDQMITPVRIYLVESILRKNCKIPYNILKTLLVTQLDTLKERVSIRPQLPRTYKGTLEELEEAILKKGNFDLSRFQKVFNTEQLNPNVITNEIKQMIEFLQK